MKKVLIIADLFHASPRIPGLCKYLSEFGWWPIVITGTLPKNTPENYQVIQTDFPDAVILWKRRLFLNPSQGFQKQIGIPFSIRESNTSFTSRLTNLAKGIIAYPDAHKGWKPFAIAAAERILRKEKIDAVVSSSSPVTSHSIANQIKGKYGILWIADLRDLWTQNHTYQYGATRKFFERRLELETLSSANALVTVTPVWVEQLRLLHKNKPVYLITNGFDPVEMSKEPINLTLNFTITYTGQIYTGKQNPSELLIALKELILDKAIEPQDIAVRFYGAENESLTREIKACGLSTMVKQYGPVPRDVSFEKQRESQVLLLLNWTDMREKGVYPGKIFEYLAARRPILAVGGYGGDVVEKLLDETKAGVYCKNPESVKDLLYRYYLDFKKSGKLAYKGDAHKINKYNYRDLARELAHILERFDTNS